MIIDTSNALAAPGSSRGYACLSVACRSIAPGGASGLLGVRGWGLPRRARRGPPSPQAQTRRRPPSPSAAPAPFPLPPRSRVGWCGGKGGPGWETGEGRAAPPPAKREREERAVSVRVPAAAAAAAAARVPPSGGLPRAARGSGCGVRWPGPGGRSRAAVVARRRRRRWGRVSWGWGGRKGEVGGVARGEVGGARPGRRGSPPAPGGGPASGRPPLPRRLLPAAAAPHRHRPPVLPARPARSARQGPEARPAARPAAPVAAFPGFACPRR